MNQITRVLEGIGSTVLLLTRSLRYLPTLPRQFHRFIEQSYLIGYTTLPIVAILSFFIGSVLASCGSSTPAASAKPAASAAPAAAAPSSS